MPSILNLTVLVASLGLAACVGSAPVQLAPDHPGNPAAASGSIDISTALQDYQTPDDFATREAADKAAAGSQPGHGGMQHGGMAGMSRDMMSMPGMDHGDATMTGKQPGGAPRGAVRP